MMDELTRGDLARVEENERQIWHETKKIWKAQHDTEIGDSDPIRFMTLAIVLASRHLESAGHSMIRESRRASKKSTDEARTEFEGVAERQQNALSISLRQTWDKAILALTSKEGTSSIRAQVREELEDTLTKIGSLHDKARNMTKGAALFMCVAVGVQIGLCLAWAFF